MFVFITFLHIKFYIRILTEKKIQTLKLERNQQNRSSRNSINNNTTYFISIEKRFRIDKKVQEKHSIANTTTVSKKLKKQEYGEFFQTWENIA